MNDNDELIVILEGKEGIEPKRIISKKKFISYKYLYPNTIEIIEKLDKKTRLSIKPHNEHVLKAVKMWEREV